MSDFIYNDLGICVARVVNGKVFSEASNQGIATVSQGSVYGLDGTLIGSLWDAGLVRGKGDFTPDIFLKLVDAG